eukprot:CAMPEP_0183350254 /NCGR_PEP_ID=MMETSP0164_2-20130417/18390_1 /TAXON_ID=221442 /ORGANISM="Coccolithus pelagicus ssp braarudi, Strain PLY182g" /LENGTH=121 /DNA_ID=CAMNT_0025522145 /DNA_START=627 /DNA_END=989 /DNA_ORIENTATION=+
MIFVGLRIPLKTEPRFNFVKPLVTFVLLTRLIAFVLLPFALILLLLLTTSIGAAVSGTSIDKLVLTQVAASTCLRSAFRCAFNRRASRRSSSWRSRYRSAWCLPFFTTKCFFAIDPRAPSN